MSAKTKIEKITVKIGDLELNLTHEEAKSLYATLGEIVGVRPIVPFIIEREHVVGRPYPVPSIPNYYQPKWHPGEIICQSPQYIGSSRMLSNSEAADVSAMHQRTNSIKS